MSVTSERNPSLRQKPIFVPSPRYLSESPAFPRPQYSTGGTSQTGSGSSRGHHSPPHFHENLISPIPPPPANLHAEPPATFNVDPGVPFLATEGPSSESERGSLDSRSKDGNSPSQPRFVGGFVTGLKRIRKSLRQNTRDYRAQPLDELSPIPVVPQMPVPQLQAPTGPALRRIRDSGYASEPSPLESLPPQRKTSTTEAHVSHDHQHDVVPPQAPTGPAPSTAQPQPPTVSRRSNKPASAYYPLAQKTIPTPPLEALSPVSATLEYGSDYRYMDVPDRSDMSIGSYVRGIKGFVKDIASLPFSSRGRVTYDYYPEIEQRDERHRKPAIEWKSRHFTGDESPFKEPNTLKHNHHKWKNESSYYIPYDNDDNGGPIEVHGAFSSSSDSSLQAPHRHSGARLDLDQEFEPVSRPQTPYSTQPPPGLTSANATPRPPPQQIVQDFGPSPVHSFQWQTSADPNLVLQLPVSPMEGATPNSANQLLVYPYQYDPNYVAIPTNGYQEQYHIPPQVQAQPQAQPQSQTPHQDQFLSPYHTPLQPIPPLPANYPYPPSASPIKFIPSPEQWEPFPQYLDRTGYVAPEYAETHYGEQYGAGIHSASAVGGMPPMHGLGGSTGPPSRASTASTSRRRPRM